LLLRHYKNKKLQKVFIELLLEKVFINSNHIYDFFVEANHDSLDKNKYI
jgi:hypothetical protein